MKFLCIMKFAVLCQIHNPYVVTKGSTLNEQSY